MPSEIAVYIGKITGKNGNFVSQYSESVRQNDTRTEKSNIPADIRYCIQKQYESLRYWRLCQGSHS